jgi:hypothetical protein
MLHRKDDWDEALEEARNNAIARGEAVPIKPFVPGPDYDYGISYTFTLDVHYDLHICFFIC